MVETTTACVYTPRGYSGADRTACGRANLKKKKKGRWLPPPGNADGGLGVAVTQPSAPIHARHRSPQRPVVALERVDAVPGLRQRRLKRQNFPLDQRKRVGGVVPFDHHRFKPAATDREFVVVVDHSNFPCRNVTAASLVPRAYPLSRDS